MQKPFISVNKSLKINILKIKKYRRVGDHYHHPAEYRGVGHSIYNLKYNLPKEILIVFYNGSSNDYHFIIKELVEEFEGQFTGLGENIKKYITFSVPKTIDEKGKEIIKTIYY